MSSLITWADWAESYARMTPQEAIPQEEVQAVITILDRWYWIMEAGAQPIALPEYNKPLSLSIDQCDDLITEIDHFFERELRVNKSYWSNRGIKNPPRFSRLPLLQRMALAQELEAVFQH